MELHQPIVGCSRSVRQPRDRQSDEARQSRKETKANQAPPPQEKVPFGLSGFDTVRRTNRQCAVHPRSCVLRAKGGSGHPGASSMTWAKQWPFAGSEGNPDCQRRPFNSCGGDYRLALVRESPFRRFAYKRSRCRAITPTLNALVCLGDHTKQTSIKCLHPTMPGSSSDGGCHESNRKHGTPRMAHVTSGQGIIAGLIVAAGRLSISAPGYQLTHSGNGTVG